MPAPVRLNLGHVVDAGGRLKLPHQAVKAGGNKGVGPVSAQVTESNQRELG